MALCDPGGMKSGQSPDTQLITVDIIYLHMAQEAMWFCLF